MTKRIKKLNVKKKLNQQKKKNQKCQHWNQYRTCNSQWSIPFLLISRLQVTIRIMVIVLKLILFYESLKKTKTNQDKDLIY